MRTASAATSGVCSAGLASTGLPAASAAATWPVKIASGKFHGLMQTTGPSGTVASRCRSRARTCARVVAQEVDRLAHLGDGVGAGLAGLAHEQRRSGAACRLRSRSARALEHRGALGGRRRRPARRGFGGARRAPPRRRPASASRHVADDVAPIGRVAHRLRAAGRRTASTPSSGSADHGVAACAAKRRGQRAAAALRRRGRGRASWRARRRTARAAAGSPDAAGRARLRARPAPRPCAPGSRTSSSSGTASVGDAVDERGVGAVLEQPPHQVGEQRVVRADRRVDAARPAELAFGRARPRPARTAARPCRAGTGTRTVRGA